MRWRLDDGTELDDDPTRIDRAAVRAFLVEEAYWITDRSLADVERAVAVAARVLGAYDTQGRQIAFARVVSDHLSVAYLDDVYVLASHRGRGIGAAIVRELVTREPLASLNWILLTADAHAFYEQFGFTAPPSYLMMRSRARPG
jgi:GNAT superfamily N-acetyltransferase